MEIRKEQVESDHYRAKAEKHDIIDDGVREVYVEFH